MARKRMTGVAEAVAALSARRVNSRPKAGKRSALTPLEARFVEATVLGAPSQLQAATIAGYSDPHAQAYEVAARPIVAAAIEERRSAAMARANIDLARVYRNLATYNDDTDPAVRSSAVRAGEIILRAAGELGPDVRVNVDNRSVILPAVDPERAAAAYGAMFANAEAPSPGLTDGGMVGGGGA